MHNFNRLLKQLSMYHLYVSLAIILFVVPTLLTGYGFDGGASCDKKNIRRGRARQLLERIPCDLTVHTYCNLPGSMYPWNAVRRFVNENQGLMKRMYGDVRHISILRNEVNNNDIELDDIERTSVRYSRSGWKKNKYLYSEYQNSKNNDILSEPHFRPAVASSSPVPLPSSSSSTATSETPIRKISTSTTITSSSSSSQQEKLEELNNFYGESSHYVNGNQNANEDGDGDDDDDGIIDDADDDGDEEDNGVDESLIKQIINYSVDNNNNIYENITDYHKNEEHFQIVNAPNLAPLNKTETSTISTILRIVPPIRKYEANSPKSTIVTSSISTSTTTTTTTTIPRTTSTVATTAIDDEDVEFITAEHFTEVNPIKMMDNNDVNVHHRQQEQKHKTSSQSLSPVRTNYVEEYKDVVPKHSMKFTPKPVEKMEGQLFQDALQKEPPVVINQRGVNACPVKEEVVAPFWANNTRGEVLALLNLYPFEQYVHWEKCTQEHKQMYCREGCVCEQQYRLHRLLAYDPHNECRGIFSDWFRFPSCCICKCYDIPMEYRLTSRSPRSIDKERQQQQQQQQQQHGDDDEDGLSPIDLAERTVKRAIYEYATEHLYRHGNDIELDEF